MLNLNLHTLLTDILVGFLAVAMLAGFALVYASRAGKE